MCPQTVPKLSPDGQSRGGSQAPGETVSPVSPSPKGLGDTFGDTFPARGGSAEVSPRVSPGSPEKPERDQAADAAARATRDARLDRDAPGLRDDIARLMAAFPGTTGRGMRITIGGEVVWPPRKEG